MADAVSLSLEETNEIRKKLGLKPIRTEVQKSDKSANKEAGSTHEINISSSSKNSTSDGHAVSSLENHQLIDGDKINFLRKKLAQLNGRIHGAPRLNDVHNNGESENGDWLNKVGEKKYSKPANSVQMNYEDEEDLPLLKLSHKMTDIAPGKDVILTLKESAINDDEVDNDVLENEKLSHEKEDAKKLQLRQMNKDRRRKRMKLQISSVDIEAEEVQDDGSVLLIGAERNVSDEGVGEEPAEEHKGKVKVVFNNNNQINSDSSETGDFKPIKIKKRKKRDTTSASKNKRVKLPSEMERVNLVDEDYSLEDVENEFEIPKNTLKRSTLKSVLKTPEQIASEIRKEKYEKQQRAMDIAHLKNLSKGLVVDEGFTFLESLKSNLVDRETDKLNKEAEKEISERHDLAAAMQTDLHPGHFKNEADNPLSTIAQREPDFYDGLASTLRFLQDKNVLPSKESASTPSYNDGNERAESIALSKSVEVRKIRERIAAEVSKNAVKYSKDELERIKQYEEDEIMKKMNKIQSQELQGYNPQVQLVYKDEKGNQLTTKEAYKKLSQKFHGTKSNKKKLAKFQSKVELRGKQTERNNNSFNFL